MWTHVDEEVEESGVQSFGQSVSGESGLLSVQGDGDGLGLPPPLTVHNPAGQFTAEAVLIDPQQEGRECQDWQEEGRRPFYRQEHSQKISDYRRIKHFT